MSFNLVEVQRLEYDLYDVHYLDELFFYLVRAAEYVGDTRTVDVHIKRIREKLHDNEDFKISTIWGIGYKFETTQRSR